MWQARASVHVAKASLAHMKHGMGMYGRRRCDSEGELGVHALYG